MERGCLPWISFCLFPGVAVLGWKQESWLLMQAASQGLPTNAMLQGFGPLKVAES